jgi:M6 family metalloprotease-like protein
VLALKARIALLVVVVSGIAWTVADDSPRASVEACAPPVLGGGVGEGRNDPRVFPASVGELRTVMLFVDFADVRATADPRAVYETFVPRGVEWFRDVSYGRLRLVVMPLFRQLTLRGRASDYRPAGARFGLARSALEEAVARADAQIDFRSVQAVYLVLPYAAIETIGAIGAVILTEALRLDGAEIRARTVLFDQPIGGEAHHYLAHETGHMLGLPHVSGHAWDVMSTSVRPRGMFAWHRWKLGWLDSAQIVCLAGRRRVEATLTPLERAGGTKAIIVRRGRYAYVAEVRAPAAGHMGARCRGGVLISEVEFGPPPGRLQIRLSPARIETTGQRVRCGRESQAPFGRGRGEVSRLRRWGLQFDVLAAHRNGSFRVRVTALGP